MALIIDLVRVAVVIAVLAFLTIGAAAVVNQVRLSWMRRKGSR